MSVSFRLVVMGLGYVGLPLALEAARAGLQVVGVDENGAVVSGLNQGRSHVDDVTDGEPTFNDLHRTNEDCNEDAQCREGDYQAPHKRT